MLIRKPIITKVRELLYKASGRQAVRYEIYGVTGSGGLGNEKQSRKIKVRFSTGSHEGLSFTLP